MVPAWRHERKNPARGLVRTGLADTAVIVVAEAITPQAGFVFLGRLPRCWQVGFSPTPLSCGLSRRLDGY